MMACGDYSIIFDKTGFPLLQKEEWNYAISLFPVSKYQFERFMAEKGPVGNWYTDQWYRALLQNNPRGPWRRYHKQPWELFMTGVSRDEIEPFLRYLGRAFRFPHREEWNGLLEVSNEIRKMGELLAEQCREQAAPPVTFWLQTGFFPHASEGLLEMLDDEGYCIGKPWQELQPNTWHPTDVREVNWEVCPHIVGFRVVREMNK